MIDFHALAGSAAATVAALALATRTRPVQRLDDALEEAVSARPRLVVRLAGIGTLPGERYVHPLIGAVSAAAILLARPGGSPLRVLLPLAFASLGAIVAHHAIKIVYRRPRPAIALGRNKTEPAFPSGHTADATAVVLTSAWLLVHEGLLPPSLAIPLAIVLCAVTGMSRVALGWHWGSDVVGGWLTGIAVAAECVALYERLSGR
ncbi:MAG: phosphoesterase PA-phosphatase related protein [Gemmatimonadetes bacterium]|nr:phosphoesterase PA-phosphatase related protein [Gemmatimonadota bacterium]